jgi:trehalose synthase-fused probable maltokinase
MPLPDNSTSRSIPAIHSERLSSDPENARGWGDDIIEKLAPVLAEYITTRRWFRAKTRVIRELRIDDVISLPEIDSSVLVTSIEYTEGNPDVYLIPLSVVRDGGQQPPEEELLARLHLPGGEAYIMFNALANQEFNQSLLSAITCKTVSKGRHGDLIGARTSALDRECDDKALPLKATVSRAEQSNSSIIFEDRYILKLFRKLEPGVNPDIEIGAFLTEHFFKNTPAVLGFIEYLPRKGEPTYAAILQAFVRNQGDAWKFTLEALKGFYKRALAEGRSAPPFKSSHPMHLAETAMPGTAREIIGPFLKSACVLGERTAEMHAVLSSDSENPDFRPVAFTPERATLLHEELLKESDTAFGLLRRKENSLSAESAKLAHSLLARETQVRKCFASLPNTPIKAMCIRHHGDYHLGQVLATGDDFMIIDFEGEPARSIMERREKALAVRDVAGMVRSFQYAAYAALRENNAIGPANHSAMESWADYWAAWVSAAFLRAYFEKSGKLPFAPGDGKERRSLLDAFLLQKALYEIVYELNNRPDWVPIPLRGLLCLLN